ncbi:helix-turn-helix domain-containing protein [[Mycobacterium] nativiensis]|uniref:Helix-turn-helix domain-containing protein n=1 Tax=[Mycobacterium] nativiensis TaxID=2855503 RepID=A0ABU5XWP9_9MYCO|nr:helix-turn-helix domain-containing protein [Mycolicibacter sp. MYC340]MEB3032365.1 helix-turn-helix domain-containing protein [Mycolicibacter sp. MYC340]
MTGSPECGSAIRAARRARGLTVRELAQSLRVSAATVSAIENGKTGISVTRLRECAQVLGVTPTQILAGPAPVPAVAPEYPRAEIGRAPRRDWRSFPPHALDGVLSAAIDAFVETGYHGSTMRDLAARAGMSVPGIYHHYPDKQALLVASLDLTMTELHWRVNAARNDAKTGLQEVRLIVEALALFHTHRQKLAFIGASEMRSLTAANRQRIADSRNQLQHILDAAITRAAREGNIGVEDRRIAGRAIATMCTSLPQWFNAAGPTTPEETARTYADFAVSLLTKQRRPGPPFSPQPIGGRM